MKNSMVYEILPQSIRDELSSIALYLTGAENSHRFPYLRMKS